MPLGCEVKEEREKCRSGEETSWREEVSEEGGRGEGKAETRGAHRSSDGEGGQGGRRGMPRSNSAEEIVSFV